MLQQDRGCQRGRLRRLGIWVCRFTAVLVTNIVGVAVGPAAERRFYPAPEAYERLLSGLGTAQIFSQRPHAAETDLRGLIDLALRRLLRFDAGPDLRRHRFGMEDPLDFPSDLVLVKGGIASSGEVESSCKNLGLGESLRMQIHNEPGDSHVPMTFGRRDGPLKNRSDNVLHGEVEADGPAGRLAVGSSVGGLWP